MATVIVQARDLCATAHVVARLCVLLLGSFAGPLYPQRGRCG